ncbi:MAG: FGGY family carbohydrate kinase [Candidatus Limivicinus sp.]|nr:FGGY family carbohydrate kinase [Candidatus Limivicinus sp.]
MSKRMTLGVDFGGSSSKATLLDSDGKILATSTQEYPCYFPEHGWAEYDAEDLYKAFVYNVRECLEKAGISADEISAVALDAATHMAVFCGEDDKPLRRIIHWSDNRSSAQARYLKENCADTIRRFCINSPSPAWTLPQIMWLNEHEPEIMKKTRRIYFAKDYIRHLVTGDFVTDSIEAMGPMLVNDFTGEWSPELCALGKVDISTLPEIRQPTDIAGYVGAKTAAETGLSTRTPVIVGATDTVLEVYASGAVAQGCATVKLATAGRICPITARPIDNFQFFNYRHIIPGLWYPGTTSRTCAASYKWYRDVFGTFEAGIARGQNTSAYEILNRAAEQVPAGSEGLFFHPYLQGELTPYYDDSLRASFTGVSMHHTKGHFTRAVMEGISYSMRDCLEEIRAQNIKVDQYRIIGGGAKGKLWRQILCDILGTPLTCTMDNDSSLGSAMLAGVAIGMFDSFEESVERCVRVADEVTPIPENMKIYEEGFQIYREIEKAMAPVYRRIK